jgi:hypothetical protein
MFHMFLVLFLLGVHEITYYHERGSRDVNGSEMLT